MRWSDIGRRTVIPLRPLVPPPHPSQVVVEEVEVTTAATESDNDDDDALEDLTLAPVVCRHHSRGSCAVTLPSWGVTTFDAFGGPFLLIPHRSLPPFPENNANSSVCKHAFPIIFFETLELFKYILFCPEGSPCS